MIYFGFKWTVTVLAILGVVLNIKKKRLCFFIWIFTNGAWMLVDFYEGIYAQAFLFFIYFCLAIWGYVAWKDKL